jgi:predicted TIM-barrel fold metal-dependent hydrolase
MSQQVPKRLSSVETIVDTDAHVRESWDDIIPYIENQAIKRRVEAASIPTREIFSGTQVMPNPGPGYKSGELTNTSEKKLSEMDEFGIDYGILTPTLFNQLPTANNPEVASELARAFNRWMLEEFVGAEQEHKGAIFLAPQKPTDAAEEIDKHAHEDDFVAVSLPTGGLLPPLGDKKYDPIYEAAQNHGLPILLHATNNAMLWTMPTLYRHMETKLESHFISHNFISQWNLGSAIFRGLPERFPDLDLVFQEAGIGYIPHVKWRLDDSYLEKSEEVPLLDKLPSEYIDDCCYFSTQPIGHTKENPDHMAKAIEMAGSQNIMYASDLPHRTFDPPETLYDIISGEFDHEEIDAMMGGTATEVFNLS